MFVQKNTLPFSYCTSKYHVNDCNEDKHGFLQDHCGARFLSGKLCLEIRIKSSPAGKMFIMIPCTPESTLRVPMTA